MCTVPLIPVIFTILFIVPFTLRSISSMLVRAILAWVYIHNTHKICDFNEDQKNRLKNRLKNGLKKKTKKIDQKK